MAPELDQPEPTSLNMADAGEEQGPQDQEDQATPPPDSSGSPLMEPVSLQTLQQPPAPPLPQTGDLPQRYGVELPPDLSMAELHARLERIAELHSTFQGCGTAPPPVSAVGSTVASHADLLPPRDLERDKSHGDSSSSSSSSSSSESSSDDRHRRHKRRRHSKGHRRHKRHRAQAKRPHRYSKKGQDPPKKLGADKNDYAEWSFYMDMKFRDDKPLFPSDSYKIRYGLTQTTAPLWSNMRAWLQDKDAQGIRPTWREFLQEVESFLDVKHLTVEARNSVESVRQLPGEDVSTLFARMSSLWLQCSMPTHDRLRTFRQALFPTLQRAVALVGDATLRDERDLLESVRTAQHNLDLQRQANPQPPARTDRSNRWRNRFSSTPQSLPFRRNHNNAPHRGFPTQQPSIAVNAVSLPAPYAGPKPAGWVGDWFEPNPTPGPLSQTERRTLQQQGRCFRCRGSGHSSFDSVCPNPRGDAARQFNAITTATNVSASAPSSSRPASSNDTEPTDKVSTSAEN